MELFVGLCIDYVVLLKETEEGQRKNSLSAHLVGILKTIGLDHFLLISPFYMFIHKYL